MNVLTYRGRSLEVSGEVIKTFEEMEITREAKVEEEDYTIKDEKVGSAVVKSLKADSVSFEVLLLSEAGVDVWEEVKGWRALVGGQRARIYFAGTDILGFDMVLTECNASQMKMGTDGKVARAKVKLTFQRSEKKPKKITPPKDDDLNWEAVNRYNNLMQGGKEFIPVFTSPAAKP